MPSHALVKASVWHTWVAAKLRNPDLHQQNTMTALASVYVRVVRVYRHTLSRYVTPRRVRSCQAMPRRTLQRWQRDSTL